MPDGMSIGHYSGTDTGVTVLYCGPVSYTHLTLPTIYSV